MEKALKKARRHITLSTVLVATICALASTLAMYFIVEARLNDKINAAKIGTLASSNSELSAYIASQEPYHAHFETIASIIQREDRNQLSEVLPFILGTTFIVSALAGYGLARYLLRPVRESFVSQRRFMQDAAHELRNPLAAMQTQIEQALSKPPGPAGQKKLLEAIDRQATHLSAITTDLLLLERREYPGTEQTDISELLRDILEGLHHQASAKNIKLSLDVADNFRVTIDPQHFVYIAKNLIENAIKFSKKGQTVSIKLVKHSGNWQLVVRDRGIGIPAKDLDHITQRFYRANNAEATDGTGLGMAIVAKFVNIYKGKIDIKSAVGKGTIVSVSI